MKYFLTIFITVALTLPAITLADEITFKLINQRLMLMKSVAAYKWINNIAIEDKVRERIVIQRAKQSSLKLGLAPASVGQFVSTQIEVAKQIQRYWFEEWAKGSGPTESSDLMTQVRPQLLTLSQQIISSLKSPEETLDITLFFTAVSVVGLSEATKGNLYRSLEAIKRYDNRLQQILETGILRIGTTGDYAPFSFWADNQSTPRGSDIKRAESLAENLGVEPIFVKTSWPTLTQDLIAGNFDIIMSGVSVTQARKEFGHFSIPYHLGGKTAIARCKDQDKFNSLDAINKSSVRVIVNPGGTNENFVNGYLSLATKVIHMDNRNIFAQLVKGRADVMITDRIEVDLQTSIHSKLCSTTKENFTYQEKAYWMPKDEDLKQRIDSWLSTEILLESGGTHPSTSNGET